MSALFSDPSSSRRNKPPKAALRQATSFLDEEDDRREQQPAILGEDTERCVGVRFDAVLDVSELDERGRPGAAWSAQARELSRSGLALRSRRMCYVGTLLLVAVHLIDDFPVPLCGKVTYCTYDGDGMYRVELALMRVPARPNIAAWLAARKAH
jgi:hypothetical protein